jgi:DNA-binding HTH domain-containing proteins
MGTGLPHSVVELRKGGLVVSVSGEPHTVSDLVDTLRRRYALDVARAEVHEPDGCPGIGHGGDEWASLTGQETAIAGLVGQAMTNQQIANRLHISPHTVNYHLRQIYRKLAIGSRVHLAQLVQVQQESGLERCVGA